MWLADLRETARPTSLAIYQSEVNKHIISTIGQLPVEELTPDSGIELARELEGRGLSPRTAGDVAKKLGQALRWGVEHGYDVPILKELPLERDRQALRVLSDWESARLEASLTGEDADLVNMILLAWRAGLSTGEVCALTCGEVDWTERTITVSRICQRVPGGLSYIGAQRRVVPLPEGLHRLRSAAESGFFIRPADGGAEPRLCQRWLKKHLKDHGLPEDIGFAVLRNTYIRDLMAGGEDFIRVSVLSGVKDLNELWRRYGAYYSR